MPINLAGGYAAGGMNDALLDLVKQRMLEQQLEQRAEEERFQRARQMKLDARADEQTQYQHTRDAAGDARQKDLDRIAEETRTQQNQVAKFNVLKGMPNADITASLGEDPTTAHAVPTATPDTLPSGAGPSYRLPAVPMQPNRMEVGGLKIRPPSAEGLNEEAAVDEERKTQNAIKIAQASRVPHVTSLQHVEGGTFNPETGEYKQATGWTPPKSGSDALSINQQMLAVDRLSKQWEKAIAPAVAMQQQVSRMREGMATARTNPAQGSEAVLVTFQKMLDPGSVVRESEFSRPGQHQSLMNQIQGTIERLQKGGANIPIDELQKYADLAERIAGAQNKTYIDSTKKRIGAVAQRFGIQPELIFTEFQDSPDAGGGGTGGATNQTSGTLPPVSQRVVGKTEAVINGKPMVWAAGGWVPK